MSRQCGTYVKYVQEKCRCAECRAANTAYERERARRKVYETTTPGAKPSLIDADLVREHLSALRAQGMGLKRIAAAAGICHSWLIGVTYGSRPDDPSHPDHRPPRKRVRREIAEKVLAVRLDLAPSALVNQAGTARRLQALVACGWSQRRIAARLGWQPTNLTRMVHGDGEVMVATREAVRALYDELWDVEPPIETSFDRASITRARAMAQRNGWAPPLAWDDDTIDDPEARPDLGQGGFVPMLERVRELADLGYKLPEIAHRLGKTDQAVRDYVRHRDPELGDRIHVDLNEMDTPRGQGFTHLLRRQKAA